MFEAVHLHAFFWIGTPVVDCVHQAVYAVVFWPGEEEDIALLTSALQAQVFTEELGILGGVAFVQVNGDCRRFEALFEEEGQ